MSTHTLQLTGTLGFWPFVFVHPFLSFLAFCFLVLAVFGTLTDVGVALSKRGK